MESHIVRAWKVQDLENWPDDGRKGDRNMLPLNCNT
jgi:hypothetical protein